MEDVDDRRDSCVEFDFGDCHRPVVSNDDAKGISPISAKRPQER